MSRSTTVLARNRSNIPAIVVAGTASGVGKTTLTLWLLMTLRELGLVVRSFKIGPDYIDPYFHSQLTGESAVNLDHYLMSRSTLKALYDKYSEGADVCVVEGVMGLYDGHRSTRGTSTADVARALGVPVLLVLDCARTGQSLAAIARGFVKYPGAPKFAGLFLNNVASEKHLEIIKKELLRTVPVKIAGHMMRSREKDLPETHLGLDARAKKKLIANKIRKAAVELDLARILDPALFHPKTKKAERARVVGGDASKYLASSNIKTNFKEPSRKPVIAVAYDDAFFFYYRSDMDALSQNGFRVEYFSPLKDRKLPKGTDILFLGGGYPEHFASSLSENADMLSAVKHHRADGGLIYAECGGLIYLSQELSVDHAKFPLAGILPITVTLGRRRQSLGYVEATMLQDSPIAKSGSRLRGHRFHWSSMKITSATLSSAYDVGEGELDGFADERLLASYVHLNLGTQSDLIPTIYKNTIRMAR